VTIRRPPRERRGAIDAEIEGYPPIERLSANIDRNDIIAKNAL
jgi:hypothetical protein